jgi:hypothetical protein
MRIKVPPRKIRERFFLIYELEGCRKAVDFLTEHCGVRQMKIELDGRKGGNGNIAIYFQNRAYFSKRGLKKRTVLHELYHHLVYVNGLEMPKSKEERDANSYSKAFMSRHSISR